MLGFSSLSETALSNTATSSGAFAPSLANVISTYVGDLTLKAQASLAHPSASSTISAGSISSTGSSFAYNSVASEYSRDRTVYITKPHGINTVYIAS